MDQKTKKKIKIQNIVILSVSSLAALVIIVGFSMDLRSPQGHTAEGINYNENYYQDIEQYTTPSDVDEQTLSARREVSSKEYKIASGTYKVTQEVSVSSKYSELVKVGEVIKSFVTH